MGDNKKWHFRSSFIVLYDISSCLVIFLFRYLGISFWFKELINNITPQYISITKLITTKEIENAKKYLLKKNIPDSKANLTTLLGCNFFSSYNDLK